MKKWTSIFAAAITLFSFGKANAQDVTGRPPLEKEPQTAEAVSKLVPEDAYALPWERIKEENILWKRRVWREIDVTDVANAAFLYNRESPDFANILIQGVMAGKFKAYSAGDDRFTKGLSLPEFSELMAGGKNPANSFSAGKC